MTEHLTVVLGSGFSANAGIPKAKDIDDSFNRDLRNKIRSYSSSEWAWIDEKNDAYQRNSDSLCYSYVLNEIVKKYKNAKKDFINYEDFYQFIIDNYSNPKWVEELFETAKNSLLIDRPDLNVNADLFTFNNKQFHLVGDIINYLIRDILATIPNDDAELIKIYKGFIIYLSRFDSVDIFTLNHDLLLERVLKLYDLKYSKGFTTQDSTITHNNSPVPFFNNIFNEKIKIHKLHGSLDFFQYRHYVQDGGQSWKKTDDYDYYMTTDYDTIHDAQRIDQKTKKIVQSYNFDIVPKFITGSKKLDTIENDTLFNKLFQNFQKAIIKSNNLFISGYSFRDQHLDEILKSKEFNYINQNPTEKYPFDGKGRNIINLNELIKGN